MNCCDNPDPQPFDLLTGAVEAHDVEFTTNDDGTVELDYEPTGWTEVEWDSQTTIGVLCQSCWKPTIVHEWLEDFVRSALSVELPIAEDAP